MRVLSIVSIAVITLLAFAGALQAQIAAPRLNPATLESPRFSPNRLNKALNPAVLPWSGPSRIGAAITSMDVTDTSGGVTTTVEGDGTILQGRFVGENFAIGAEFYQIDTNAPAGGGPPPEFESTMIALAYQFGELFSVGFSRQESIFPDSAGDSSETLPQLGATLRLGEVFFLGLARGDESVQRGGGGGSGDRAVTHVGVGYHWREGDRGAHIELYRQSAEGINNPPSITEDEVEAVGFSAEFVFANILVGIESFQSENTDATSGVLLDETDETTLSVGWVPEQGLSLTANFVEEERTDKFSGDITLIETLILGLAWLF